MPDLGFSTDECKSLEELNGETRPSIGKFWDDTPKKTTSAQGTRDECGQTSANGRRVTIYLTDDLFDEAYTAGSGNISKGIRLLIQRGQNLDKSLTLVEASKLEHVVKILSSMVTSFDGVPNATLPPPPCEQKETEVIQLTTVDEAINVVIDVLKGGALCYADFERTCELRGVDKNMLYKTYQKYNGEVFGRLDTGNDSWGLINK